MFTSILHLYYIYWHIDTGAKQLLELPSQDDPELWLDQLADLHSLLSYKGQYGLLQPNMIEKYNPTI